MEKYKIDREVFIEYLGSAIIPPPEEVIKYLKLSGEYIIEADNLLHACDKIPVDLLQGYVGTEKFVAGYDCQLTYGERKVYSKKDVNWIIETMYKEFCSGTGLEEELESFKNRIL